MRIGLVEIFSGNGPLEIYGRVPTFYGHGI
jgi:hypothetical protein